MAEAGPILASSMQTDAPQFPTTIELPLLSREARLSASSINADNRTVEVTWTTGAPVVRANPYTGERWIEKLSMDPAHIRLDRLNNGAPVLDTHSGWSLAHQLGVVEDGTAKISGKRGIARLRFSKRADVEPVWQDVQDRIVRNVSQGYAVHKYEVTPAKRDGDLPVYNAVDWEPYEISMVPMPADAGAQTRSEKQSAVTTYPCQIITRAAGDPQEPPMEEQRNDQSEFVVEQPAVPAEPRLRMASETPAAPTDAEIAAEVERKRINGIHLAVRAAGLPFDYAQRLIDAKTPLVDAQSTVFEEMRKRGGPNVPRETSRTPEIEFGESPLVHERAGIEEALLHRCSPQHFKLTDKGRSYRAMSLLDIARTYLNARGVRTTDMSRMQLAATALTLNTRGGYHSTSDFPLLLADVANKTLRASYAERPQSFRSIARQANLPDFKPVYRNQLGDAPQLLKVPQHGEFKRGTIGEARETYQLATYGRIFGITRQALVNDDLSGFARVPADFGREARNLESNLVWEQITANAQMGDGQNLFSAAHANIDSVGAIISVASIGAGRAAIRKQRGLGSADQVGHRLNLSASFLIVPTSLETKADQFTSQITASRAADVNPFAGSNRLQVIAEPRLDDDSELSWYLAASADQIAIIEFGYLEGEEGPMVETQIGFNVDGVDMKCRLDFAAKAIDYRGVYKNVGAAEEEES
jgi:hypothetical protein